MSPHTIDPLESRALLSTIYVDASAPGPAHDGSSWASAYVDLQRALKAAVSGDRIDVAQGTYKPTSATDRNVSFKLKDGVGIYGGYAGSSTADPNARDVSKYATVLSGAIAKRTRSYHVVRASSVGPSTVLDGITITAGRANGHKQPELSGAGMYNVQSSPTLNDCIFTGNWAHSDRDPVSGGGMYNLNSSPTLRHCKFIANWAFSESSSDGGGMYNQQSSPTLIRCTFSSNRAIAGAGIYNESSSPRLLRCTFTENAAGISGGFGGGMCNDQSSPTLSYCVFRKNSTTAEGQGAGMGNTSDSMPILSNCAFIGNNSAAGGGMENDYGSSPTLINCLFSGNRCTFGGGGIDNSDSSPTLINCSFSGISSLIYGGAISNDNSSPKLTNCILWGNPGDSRSGIAAGEMSDDSTSTPIVTYSDIHGGWTGEGNINADPRFLQNPKRAHAASYGDLRLQPSSPCINRGNNAAVPANIKTDLAGKPRIIGGRVDMGAYESPAK